MGRQNGSANWLKVQKHTPQKGMLRYAARQCECSLGDSFLAWFRLWSTFDELTADGFIAYYTAEDADQDAGLPGFAKALASGPKPWLLFDATGCTVTNWARHNGDSAKQRALKAERDARYRDKETGV